MIKNNLKAAWRNIVKNKLFFSINFVGLTIAFFSFLVIVLYCSYQLSFDTFHKNKENIYRIVSKIYKNGNLVAENATTPPPLAELINSELPEIDYVTTFHVPLDENKYIIGDNIFYAHNTWCDSSFFNVFTFPIITGDKIHPLKYGSFLISDRLAKSYFGNQDPVGQTIIIKEPMSSINKTITGVFEIPDNSHLNFDVIFSKDDFMNSSDKDWNNNRSYNYISVNSKADIKLLEKKILNIFNSQRKAYLDKENESYEFSLQRIDKIYLHSHLLNEARANGNILNITILLIIAFFLLVISWLNYNNLVTAQSIERAKEISIKKILGANGFKIGSQSIIETFVFNLVPIFFASIFLLFSLPRFNQLFGNNITLLQNHIFWFISVITVVIGTIFSGIYPAWRLASFKPKDIIAGKFSYTRKGLYLRNVFLSIQIIISLSLLIISSLVSKQMLYMKSYERGFNGKNIIVIEHPESVNDIAYNSYATFKNELLKFPQIENVTATTDFPGKPIKFRENVDKDNTSIQSDIVFSDEDYFDILNLNVLYGRDFSKVFTSDKDQVLINETAATALGYSNSRDALHQKIKIRGKWREVLGIVKNYNHLSLKNKIEPIVYINQGNCYHYYLVELKIGSLQKGMDIINNKYSEMFSGSKMNFYFLNDFFNEQYKQDDFFALLLSKLSIILICITCFGLWGLALFDSSLKKKEISIRRVFGSGITGVTLLQLKSYFKIFGISFILTVAPVYIICTNWLKNFPYRTSIGHDTFIYPGLVLFVIINLTVIYQSLKASYSNPTLILKN